MRSKFAIFLALSFAVSGCALNARLARVVNLDDGYESVDDKDKKSDSDEYRNFSSGPTLILDASKRVVTTSSYNKRTWEQNRVQPERIICAEPSPDVAQGVSKAIQGAIAAAITGKGGAEGSGSASFGYASSVAIAQLGERLATIQLLRDELSDLCRSYANGAISTTNYTLRLSSLDDKMVTLLMGEMAAGAFGRTLASVDGASSAGVAPKDAAREKELQAKSIEAAGKVAEKETKFKQAQEADLKAANGDASKVVKSDATKAAEQELAGAKAEEAVTNAELDLVKTLTAQTASMARSRQAGLLPPGSFEPAGESVVSLQRNFLNKIRIGTIIEACVTALDRADTKGDGRTDEETARLNEARKELSDLNGQIATLDREISKIDRGTFLRADEEQTKNINAALDEFEVKKSRTSFLVDEIARLESNQAPRTDFARMCGGSEDPKYGSLEGRYAATSDGQAIAGLHEIRREGLLREITRQLLEQQQQREQSEGRAREKELDGCLLVLGAPEKHTTGEAKSAIKACYSRLVVSNAVPPLDVDD